MARAVSEVGLGGDAATRARHFARETVKRWNLEDVALEVELLTTELVTNAVLHGGPPISLELVRLGPVLRVSVSDGSLLPPVLGRPSGDAMTGRGLGLVASLASQWGVTPVADDRRGKVVWAEVELAAASTTNGTGPAGDDIDALLDQWDDDGFGDLVRYPVVLPDVPTDLLLAAKAHVDNVVRELTLASSESASGSALASPRHLAELLRDVVTNFSEVRQSIKRQALAAAALGNQRVVLRLTLPVTMAGAGERYLAALDELDEYARAARLLTVETPPEHRAFRHWYVRSLIEQLHQAARGGPAGGSPTFETYLLSEVSKIALAQRISDRAARLQRVSAALAGAVRPADVARVAVTEGCAALGASGGALLLLDGEGELQVAGEVGWPGLVHILRDLPRSAATPAKTAVATQKAVWIENQEDRARFPVLADVDPQPMARCAVPLVVGGKTIGVLVFIYATAQLFATDDRIFVEALAAQTAQTVTRTRLHEEQLLLSNRLARLQAVTAELGLRRDVAGVCNAAVRHAGAAVDATVAAICLPTVDGSHLRIVDAVGGSAIHQEMWRRFPISGAFPASEAWRTGQVVLVESRAERNRRFPPMADIPADDDHTLLCLPLSIQNNPVGVLSLSFPTGRHLSKAEVDFAGALADVCAQALATAQALDTAAAARDRFVFLAEASAQLASSLNYEETLQTVADLSVPRLGDWCGIDIVEHGAIVPIAVAHIDPDKVEFAHQLRREYPPAADSSTGAAAVIASGESHLVPVVTDEMLVAAAQDERHLELIRGLGMCAVLLVPLQARARVLGALTLIRSDGDRPFSAEDIALAEDLGRRAGTAVDNARLFREVQASWQSDAGTSHTRLDLALSAADIGSFDWDIAAGTLSWDDRMCAIFGVAPGDFDSRIDFLLDAVWDDDRPGVQAAIDRAVARVSDFSAEYRVRRPDGAIRWIDTRGRVLPDPQGAAGRMLGVAFDSTEVRDARDRVARTLEHMTDGFFSLDAEWRFTYVNAAAERLIERDRGGLLGRVLWEEFPASVGTQFEHEYRRAVEQGRPATFEYYFTSVGKHFEVRAYPALDGLTVYFTDVSQHRQFEVERAELRAASRSARDEAETARTKLAFIAEASADITTTIDLAEVCRRLANHAVAQLADWVTIYVVDNGQCHRVGAAHRDERWAAAVTDLVGKYPIDLDSDAMVARAARTRTSVLEQRMTGGLVASTYNDPDARQLVEGMGVASAFVVPMTAGNDVVGVMAFIRSQPGNEFEPDDVQLAATLASRAALAVQNALLYARQTTVAQVLQQAVLPDALPAIAGVELSATYEPATGGAGVGGDFYDVFRLASGRIGLAVGDAAGHGLPAGALMGQLRNALRAYAVEGRGPGATLQSLSDLFVALEPEAFATVFYAELDPESGELVWSSAGHPPPLLTFTDALACYLDGEGGPPIGVSAPRPDDQRARIPAGGGIVMYTDGLIEHRHLSIDVGLNDLRVMVDRLLSPPGTVGAGPVDGLVTGLVQGMRHETGFADDVCVLLAARTC